jgi:hypothetical protein
MYYSEVKLMWVGGDSLENWSAGILIQWFDSSRVYWLERLTSVREVPGSKPEHGGFGKGVWVLDDGAGRRKEGLAVYTPPDRGERDKWIMEWHLGAFFTN